MFAAQDQGSGVPRKRLRLAGDSSSDDSESPTPERRARVFPDEEAPPQLLQAFTALRGSVQVDSRPQDRSRSHHPTRDFNEVVSRRRNAIPGPAGVGFVDTERVESTTSQPSTPRPYVSAALRSLLSDCGAAARLSLREVASRARDGVFTNTKIPLLACTLISVEHTPLDSVLRLADESSCITLASLHRASATKLRNILKPGVALLLVKVPVLSPSSHQHYLLLSISSFVAIYTASDGHTDKHFVVQGLDPASLERHLSLYPPLPPDLAPLELSERLDALGETSRFLTTQPVRPEKQFRPYEAWAENANTTNRLNVLRATRPLVSAPRAISTPQPQFPNLPAAAPIDPLANIAKFVAISKRAMSSTPLPCTVAGSSSSPPPLPITLGSAPPSSIMPPAPSQAMSVDLFLDEDELAAALDEFESEF